MSRIGSKAIEIPEGVELNLQGQHLKAKGKLGELELHVNDDVIIAIEEVANDEGKTSKAVVLKPKSNSRFSKQIWPTMRTLVYNVVLGVTEGYTKKLEIKGVGYRANLQGKKLVLSVGFSHDVEYEIPDGVKCEVEKQTAITITGIDKQLVGQVAAKIRGFKPPEPYKGKGIRYKDEFVLIKEGKKK